MVPAPAIIAGLGGVLLSRDLRRVVIVPGLDHLRAQRLDGCVLGGTVAARHEHGAADSVLAGGEGNGAAVVARGRRDHAARAVRRRHAGQKVERAADLEGTDALGVLQLDEHLAAGALRQQRGADQGRGRQVLPDHPHGLLDVIERDRQRAGVGPRGYARQVGFPCAGRPARLQGQGSVAQHATLSPITNDCSAGAMQATLRTS